MRTALWVVLLWSAAGVFAQEAQLFDLSDFMDPRLRGVVYESDGHTVTDQGEPFFVLRAIAGGVSDYRHRQRLTQDEIGFLHLAGSFYTGKYQVSTKYTRMGAVQTEGVPLHQLAIQFSRYTAGDVPAGGGVVAPWQDPTTDREEVVGRQSVSLLIERDPTHRRSFNYEIGGAISLRVPSVDEPVLGSLHYAFRMDATGNQHRLAYIYRHDVPVRFGRLGLGLDLHVTRDDEWHVGDVRPTVLFSTPIPRSAVTLHFAAEPTLKTHGRFRITNQIAVFADIPVIVWARGKEASR
jgi:hypothetical protein